MKREERIKDMEAALDNWTAALKDLESALDAVDERLPAAGKLFAYYGSGPWHGDREADEKGKLPPELRRGVLSEDLPYDAITDTREAALRMLETAAEMLKKL